MVSVTAVSGEPLEKWAVMYINAYVDSFIPCNLTSLTSNFTQDRPLSNGTERVSTFGWTVQLNPLDVHFSKRPSTLHLAAIKIGETITETIKECLKSLKSMLLFIMLSMDSLPLLESKVLRRKMRTQCCTNARFKVVETINRFYMAHNRNKVLENSNIDF